MPKAKSHDSVIPKDSIAEYFDDCQVTLRSPTEREIANNPYLESSYLIGCDASDIPIFWAEDEDKALQALMMFEEARQVIFH